MLHCHNCGVSVETQGEHARTLGAFGFGYECRQVHNAQVESQRPWQTVFTVLQSSPSRCVLRRQAHRYLAIRVPETGDRHLVKIFKARLADGGGTQIEDFQPLLTREGTFDDAFAILAGMVE